MATIIDPGMPTLLNVMRSLTPNGSVEMDMAETMSAKLAILDDIPWQEANMTTGHLITSRTGLPAPKWRKFNQGIDPSKSTRAQYEEGLGMLEDRSDVDVDLAKLNGNAAAFRASEDRGFLEGFGQSLETSVLYENAHTSPERIHGLTPRYYATTGYAASSYVAKGTNAGVNCDSIWLINWSLDGVFGIYPKGSAAGLQKEDMGIRYKEDASGKEFRVYTTNFQWKCGIAVKDYRYSARYQWDPDDANFADTAKGMITAIQQLLGTVYDMDATKARLYMSRRSFNKLNAQLISNTVNLLEYVELGKRRVSSIFGIPIRITDALVQESAIS